MAGFNDTYPHLGAKSFEQMEGDIYNGISDAIYRARAAAPNATIKVVGYPHITNGNGDTCGFNVIPGVMLPNPTPAVEEIEWLLQRAAQNASRDAGAVFVDSKPISNGHEQCSHDRWLVGIIDTTVPDRYNLLLHMTRTGLHEIARNAGSA